MIRFLLLARIDWTDHHPGLMAAGAAACLVLAAVLEKVLLIVNAVDAPR